MSSDFWVVEVLRDIGKFAEKAGYCRLHQAMDSAADDFLSDVRDQHLEGISCLKKKTSRPIEEQVVVTFPERVKR